VIGTGIGEVSVELLVLGCGGRGATKTAERILRLRISDVRLGEEILNGFAAEPGCVQRIENLDGLGVVSCPEVADSEVNPGRIGIDAGRLRRE